MTRGRREIAGALTLVSLTAIIVYIIVRVMIFFYASYTPVEKFFAILLMAGEFFVLIHAMGYSINILRTYSARGEGGHPAGPAIDLAKAPSVAILVAARHEPRPVLEETFITINAVNYPNKTVYFLDDSSDEKFRKEAEEIASELSLELFRRETRHGAKAGIVNDCLKGIGHKYVAIFDADQCPLPDFLSTVVPILENDARLAFVQTPQFYSNIEKNPVARGSAFQQAVFYEYICEGKSVQDAMFCCGTNIVFRREALVQVGGLDESTVTEDFATSLKLHSRGWRSYYYGHVYAFGMGPEDLTAYFKQQFRWATGTISVLKKILWQFVSKPFSMKAGQWWEYFLSGSYYVIGLAFLFLMVCPITYLLFRIPSFFARPEVYFLAFLPYIILSTSVFYFVLGKRNYSMKDLFLGQLLGICTFTVYVRAALSAFIGVKTSFGVTGKGKGASIPYYKLWPQLGFAYVSFIAVIWGINRFIFEMDPAVLANTFWALYQTVMLSSIFYFNEVRE